MPDNRHDQLVKYLSDTYSLEQQSLAQLRTAPRMAGSETLARHFRDHLPETERHAELIGKRLDAHGVSPSRLKDAVMALGGKAFLLFARLQPDTPGKLTAHAHSYEALELAAYELLIRVAERAGDADTAAAARAIRDDERSMVDRLAASFDEAFEASVGAQAPPDVARMLPAYLRDVHAIEAQGIELLEKGAEIGGDPELERLYREHLAETRSHAQRVAERLDALDERASALKDTALRAAGLNWALFFQAQGDTPGKLAAFVYAVEHLEIASYELLRRVAARAEDAETVQLCDRILADERAMSTRVAGAFDRASAAALTGSGAPTR